jgi:hypothetical protein
MFQKISSFFKRIAGWKSFLAALIIYLIFGGGVMQYAAKTISEKAGKPVQILDLQFSYSPEKARAILSEYTPEARHYCALFNAIGDSIYPIVYTALFILALAWIYKPFNKQNKIFANIHMLPLAVMLIDYCENIFIVTMLRTFPDFSDNVARTGSFFTSLKWTLVALCAFVVVYGLAMLSINKLAKR